MRQLRETRQHWRDRKRIALPEYADVRAEHRNIIALLEAGGDIQGERQLSGAWSQYSCVHIGKEWLLVYRVDNETVVLVRVAPQAEIFE